MTGPAASTVLHRRQRSTPPARNLPGAHDLRAAALPPFRPAFFFSAVVPPCEELPPEPDFFDRLERRHVTEQVVGIHAPSRARVGRIRAARDEIAPSDTRTFKCAIVTLRLLGIKRAGTRLLGIKRAGPPL
jgi:hypothetical protein